MQELQLVLNYVTIVAFVTLYGTVTWSLLRYSTRQMYRYWAVGWVIYTAAAFWGVLLSTSALVITDVFSLTGLYIGATLILDGCRERRIGRNSLPTYLGGVILLSALLIIGLIFSWPFYLVFIPLGVHVTYVCVLSIKTVREIHSENEQPIYWLLCGLIIWAASWISFPLIIILPEYYLTFMVIQAIGVVITGASMLTLFMRTLTRDLERQYKVTQIMSSLIQHDIRNYIQVAKLALELTEAKGIENDHWVDVASESLDNAKDFVDEMREIGSALTQFSQTPQATNLFDLVNSIKLRVVSEYSLDSNQVKVEISDDMDITACPLTRELLWNIFDNSFKHGSDILTVQVSQSGKSHVSMEIGDRGGGMNDEIKQFLNEPSIVADHYVQGIGLGTILIRSLAQLCKSQIHVSDIIEDSKVVGTRYRLRFKLTECAT